MNGISQPKVHILGCGLGGFLAQCYAEQRPFAVESLILSNSFVDTTDFANNAPCAEMFALMPGFVLKKLILNAFPQTAQELMIVRRYNVMVITTFDSIDFMIDKLESLTQQQISSRMFVFPPS